MFRVEMVEEVVLRGPDCLAGTQQMSPFVWKRPDGKGFDLLVRIVPPIGSGDPVTGRIWLGNSASDGLEFRMDEGPLIEPGPDPLDIAGCEDPTVVPATNRCVVYYTGIDPDGRACLLHAEGPGIRQLKKRGIAHVATSSEGLTKEAAVWPIDDDTWRLFFEYARNGRSRVGVAIGEGPDGPWEDADDPIQARPGMWDSHHLSTGPLLHRGKGEGNVMFYNGSDAYPRWGIGWALLDDDCLCEVERCAEPLISAPVDDDGDRRRIVFASSLIDHGSHVWLYFSRDDRLVLRATLLPT